MADYQVNLELAIKNAKELQRTRVETKLLQRQIKQFNLEAKKGTTAVVKNFNSLSENVSRARSALNEAAIGTDKFNDAVRQVVKVEETYNKELKKRDRALRIQRISQQKGISLVKAEIELERQLAKAKDATARKERNKRFGQTISSAAIGGAFPLLFGQTGAAAVGGGLGGLAGGAIGGQFGFALSIVGTAIGAAIDKNEKFNKSLAGLNVQFSKSGTGSKLLASDIDKLAKKLNITKEEAIAAFSAFSEFGSSSAAKSLISIFGTDSASFDLLAATNRQAALAQQIFDARKQIGNETAKQLLQQNLINDQSVVELALAEAKLKAANDRLIAEAKIVKFQDRVLAGFLSNDFNVVDPSIFGQERAQKIQEEFDKNRVKRLEDLTDKLKEAREILGLFNEAQGKFGQSGVLAFSAINDKVKDLQDEMKALQDPIRQVISLSDTMASSFEESFKGIIKGTMTVAEAFRNMLNRIADHFLDTAAKMLANQFQQGLLGLLSNAVRPETFISPNQSPELTPEQVQARFNFMRADGGPVKGGNSYIVGERGPELFSPGRSGMITPNHALGGSTNVVVNVDASGSNVEGDEQSSRQLGELIAAAVQSEIINQQMSGGLLS